MPLEENLNKILKRMWLSDEKMNNGEMLDTEEKDFYNSNLSVIKKYYEENNLYWKNKK